LLFTSLIEERRLGRPSRPARYSLTGSSNTKTVLSYDKRNRVLGEIEAGFHDKFVKAFKKYLRLDVIPEELRKKARDVLLDIRAQLYRGRF
jgi:hypothetical protein